MNALHELQRIADIADQQARRDAVATFAEERVRLFDRISVSLCRRFGLVFGDHGQDVASLVATQCLTLVTEITRCPAKVGSVTNFEGLLYVSCAPVVRAYAHSELGRAPASGMQAIMRRRAALLALRDELAISWGREPTPAQLVEEHNRRVRSTRKDSGRQGALATVNDLVCLTARHEPDPADIVVDEPDYVLHPREGRDLVAHTLAAAAQVPDPVVAQVARAWFAGYLTDGGPLATSTQIAAQLGIGERKVRHVLARVRAIAAKTLADRYGIAADQVAA